MNATTKPRILFVAEAATLAHVARPLALAQSLAGGPYEVHFACADNDLTRGKQFLFRDTRFVRWPLYSQPSARFLRAAATGARLFDAATLRTYAEEDLRLFARVRPDLVVGDLRPSLIASAPAHGVPHAALQNAYWSPAGVPRPFPLPEFPEVRAMVRLLGEPTARRLFDRVSPALFRWHLAPYNALRRAHGLPPCGDLFTALCHGDHTLFADLPEVVPIAEPPPNHRYLGPIAWSPPVPPPPWWDDLPDDRPLLYVSLGSSGAGSLWPALARAIADLPVAAMLATAGKKLGGPRPDNLFVADYLPGDRAAARADLVVGNGGSGMIYQALAAGVPFLGIPFNQDQLLAMAHGERTGAGLALRAGAADAAAIGRALAALLAEPRYREAAERLRPAVARADPGRAFAAFLREVLAPAPPTSPNGNDSLP